MFAKCARFSGYSWKARVRADQRTQELLQSMIDEGGNYCCPKEWRLWCFGRRENKGDLEETFKALIGLTRRVEFIMRLDQKTLHNENGFRHVVYKCTCSLVGAAE